MSDNPTDNRVQEPTGEDPDGTVDVGTPDREVVDEETQAAADEPVEEDIGTDHTITKEELIRHQKRFAYDEDEDDLVLVDEQRLDPVGTVASCPLRLNGSAADTVIGRTAESRD